MVFSGRKSPFLTAQPGVYYCIRVAIHSSLERAMRIPAVVFAALAFATPVAAQSATSDLSSARRDLKGLLVAQETYFSDHGRYSPDLAALKVTFSDSVTVKLIESSNNWY